MEQTTHYQLNQWAGEDRIMRTDFNADNAKLDAALYQLAQTQTTHAAALATEQQTRAAQDTAIRQEFAAADTAERQTAAAEAAAVQQALTSQAAAIRSEMASGDATVTGQIALVKLARIVTQQEAAQVDINIGGYGLSNYAELRIIPFLPNITTAYARVNNLTSMCYHTWGGSDQACIATFYGSTSSYYCTLRLSWMVNRLQCATEEELLVYVNDTDITLNEAITLNIFASNSKKFPAGCEFLIYGVKK